MAFLLCSTAVAVAQDRDDGAPDGVEIIDGGTVIRYLPAYFNEFNALTARDIMRRIPGVTSLVKYVSPLQLQEKRGFGSSGDQVLINGKRLTGKTNQIQAALERIDASRVERIEVIRGTVEGLDVRSEGLVVNLVLKEGEGLGGSGSWQTHIWTDTKGRWEPEARASYASTIGTIQYEVGIDLGEYNSNTFRARRDTFVDPSGVLFERRVDDQLDDRGDNVLTGGITVPFVNDGIANLKVRYADVGERFPRTIDRFAIAPDGSETPISNLISLATIDGTDFEVANDFELPVGPGTATGRVIFNRGSRNRVELNELRPFGGEFFDDSLELSNEVAKELIFRSSYQVSLASAHSIDVGGEAALNSLDKAIALEEDSGTGLESVTIRNPDSKVKEKRAEVFVTHFWTLSDGLALENALNVEFSRITQIGSEVDLQRSFTFPKPRVELRYDISKSDQVRASVERTISQLDFKEFVSDFDDRDDNIDTGNPDLVPEKAWEFNASYEHRLRNDGGILEGSVFYKKISDHISKVLLPGDTGSATGNIGNARAYGFEVKANMPLTFLKLPDVVIDATYTWQDTQTTDPFLGDSRPIARESGNQFQTVIRHDIASAGLAYWVEIDWRERQVGSEFNFRQVSEPFFRNDFYLQKRVFGNVSFWFNMRASLNHTVQRERMNFVGNIADGILRNTEFRSERFHRELHIGFRGKI